MGLAKIVNLGSATHLKRDLGIAQWAFMLATNSPTPSPTLMYILIFSLCHERAKITSR